MVPLVNEGWAVCNESVEHPLCGPSDNRIRVKCSVTLVVRQRFIDEVRLLVLLSRTSRWNLKKVFLLLQNKGTKRDNVESTLMYSAKIDLGGWVPASLLSILAQREWPNALVNVCRVASDMVKRDGLDNRDFFVDC